MSCRAVLRSHRPVSQAFFFLYVWCSHCVTWVQAHGEVWLRSPDELQEARSEFEGHLDHWLRTAAILHDSAKPLANALSALLPIPSASHLQRQRGSADEHGNITGGTAAEKCAVCPPTLRVRLTTMQHMRSGACYVAQNSPQLFRWMRSAVVFRRCCQKGHVMSTAATCAPLMKSQCFAWCEWDRHGAGGERGYGSARSAV